MFEYKMQQPINAFKHWKYLTWYSVKVLAINVKFCQNCNDCDAQCDEAVLQLKLKYARRAILHVDVTAKCNFIIRIGETVQKCIYTKNDKNLSGRYEDNC